MAGFKVSNIGIFDQWTRENVPSDITQEIFIKAFIKVLKSIAQFTVLDR